MQKEGAEETVVSESSDLPVDLQEKKTAKAATVTIRLRRGWLIALISLVLLLIAGGVVAKEGYYKPLVTRYNQASITLKVKEDDNAPIPKAQVSLNGKKYTTDSDGRLRLDQLSAGNYKLEVLKDGYLPIDQTLALHRRENPLQYFTLKKAPIKQYTVKGYVSDYVSTKPIVNVSVSLGDVNVLTNPNGEYTFEHLLPGPQKVHISLNGYISKDVTVTITDTDVVSAKVPLVPNGQVVFTSNRDGSRALYASPYDGSNQHRLVEPANGGEDFGAVVAPNNKIIAFNSTRDGVKDGNGQSLAKLYLVNQDGSGLKKISDTVSPSFQPIWSANSQSLFFQGYTNPQEDVSASDAYSVASGTVFDLGEAAQNPVFSADGSLIAYSVFSTETTPSTYTDPDGTPGPPTQTNEYVLKTFNVRTGERKTLSKRAAYMTDLVFSADNTSVSYDSMQDATNHRYQVQLSDASEKEVPTLAVSKRTYILSPDGQHQAFVESRDGKIDLFVVDLKGENEQRLTTLGYVDQFSAPQWDNSGKYLTFAVRREGESAIYITSLAGGDPQKIADYYPDHY